MIKKDNERISITIDKDNKIKLLFLCKIFVLSKTNTINKLISYMYDKFK